MINQNRNPQNRGFSRNGAPRGYGQQRGASPFLDSPQGQDMPGRERENVMAFDRDAPAAPDQSGLLQQALQRGTQGPQGPQGPPPTQPYNAPPQFQAGLNRAQQSMAADGYNPQQQQGYTNSLAMMTGGAGGGNPLGGQNSGVAGGQNFGAASPASPQGGSSALARYGTADIPGAENLQYGNFASQLEGFDTQRAQNPTDGYEGYSTKNTLGRYFSQVDVSQPGALKKVLALPGFMETFPEARVVEHPNGDQLDLGDGPIDVIRAAVPGGSGAAWQFDDNPGGGMPQGAFGAQGASIGGFGAQQPGGDMASQLMAALQSGQGLDGSSIEELLAALGIGQQQQQF